MRPLFVSVVVLTAGCLNNEKEKGDDLPTEGRWSILDAVVVEDTCEFDDPDDSEDTEGWFDIHHNSDGTLEVTSTVANELVVWTCTVDGDALSCPSAEVYTVDLRDDPESSRMDALVTLDAWMEGTVRSPTDLQLDFTAEIWCEGEECSVMEDLLELEMPCSTTTSLVLAPSG